MTVITGNHTIAVIKTSEDYDNLRAGLANVTSTVNELIKVGFIMVNGQKVTLEFYLGGDYKVREFVTGFSRGRGGGVNTYLMYNHKRDTFFEPTAHTSC